jgi:hypothetical protein
LSKQDKEWVHWFYGFSCLLESSFDKSEKEFMFLAVSSSDSIIAGISAYFLANNLAGKSLRRLDCLAAAETGRNRVVKALKKLKRWKKEVKKTETEIHVAIIRKYVNEAGKWIFPEQARDTKDTHENQDSSNQDSSKQVSSKQVSENL